MRLRNITALFGVVGGLALAGCDRQAPADDYSDLIPTPPSCCEAFAAADMEPSCEVYFDVNLPPETDPSRVSEVIMRRAGVMTLSRRSAAMPELITVGFSYDPKSRPTVGGEQTGSGSEVVAIIRGECASDARVYSVIGDELSGRRSVDDKIDAKFGELIGDQGSDDSLLEGAEFRLREARSSTQPRQAVAGD